MFGWLTRWFRRGPYLADERQIFTYWNGQRQVQADPLRLWRRVMAHADELRIAVKLANSISKSADQGAQELARLCREAFAIPEPPDGLDAAGTLTDDEVFGLFHRFMGYADDLKKKSKTSSTLPNNSAVLPSGFPAGPITNSSAVSGSAVSAPTCVVPPPPPPPTASPLPPMTSSPEAATTTP